MWGEISDLTEMAWALEVLAFCAVVHLGFDLWRRYKMWRGR
jgi:hypothetical protein